MDPIALAGYRHRVLEGARQVRRRIGEPPVLGILTGTGLGQIADALEAATILDYREIPHFPLPTVESHRGRLLAGRLEGRPAVVLQGRFHLYEGYHPLQVTHPIRLLQELGVRTLIVSNAAGGLRSRFSPGDILLIRDHINLTGANPLTGPIPAQWGPRFPDLSRPYDEALSEAVRAAAERIGLVLRQGVYAGLAGPSLETPAEVRFLKTAGADAVGFSTVLEVICAVHAGMRVLALSILTNVHRPEAPQPSSMAEILSVAEAAAPRLVALIRRTLSGS